jgi:formylmethanofuran dehydrogenase subunit E
MNTSTEKEDEEEKAKARLLNSFEYLLNHNGSGHLEVNTKILKRGQKEITIQCSRCHRFVVDMKETEGGN